MTPTPMNKNLSQFLENEKKEVFNEIYDNDVDNEYRYKWESWITAHDSRLIAHLREMLSLTVSDVHSVGWAYWDSDYYPTPSEIFELTEHFNKMIDKKLSPLTLPTNPTL